MSSKINSDINSENIGQDKGEQKSLSVSSHLSLSTRLSEEVNSSLEEQKKPIDLNSFFGFLKVNLDDPIYSQLTLDEATLTRMKNHMTSMKHGTYASVPLICGGPNKCPIFSQCWFTKRDPVTGIPDPSSSTYPVLAPCPVESSILKMKIQQYAREHLESSFTENPEGAIEISPSTMALLTKLAELDVYEIRCNHLLAQGDNHGEGTNLLSTTVEAIHESQSTVYFGLKEHPILSVKEKLNNQREKILKQLIATPEAKVNMKAKLKQNDNESLLARQLLNISKEVSVHPDLHDYED